MLNKSEKIYIAWHSWLVGSAIKRKLETSWYTNIIYRTHKELDLTNLEQTRAFFEKERPSYVFLAAAKVGWIMANLTKPAEYIYSNLQVQNNVIHMAYTYWVKKLILLWSSCIYPRQCPQPIKEEYLLTWPLEETNLPYAIAKIAWIKMCQSYNRQYGTNFISCMPTNLYGPNDNFDLQSSHVFPAMIRKFHEAKIHNQASVTLWWDGSSYREFLHVDDVADAIIFLMDNFNPTKEQNETGDIIFNIGTGKDITIKELANVMKKNIWYQWEIVRDTSKPNGTVRKLMDVTKINTLWWRHTIGLEEGIRKTYEWFLGNIENKDLKL